MKGLFLKEFYSLKEDIFYNLIIIIGFMIVSSFIYKVGYDIGVLSTIMGVNMVNFFKKEMLESQSNFNIYLRTLPIKLEDYIKVKYIGFLCLLILLSIIVLVMSYFYKLTQDYVDIKVSLYILIISLGIIYFSITYLMISFLKDNTSIVIVISVFNIFLSILIMLLCVGIGVFVVNVLKSNLDIVLIGSLFSLLISIILTFLSYKIVCRNVKKLSL